MASALRLSSAKPPKSSYAEACNPPLPTDDSLTGTLTEEIARSDRISYEVRLPIEQHLGEKVAGVHWRSTGGSELTARRRDDDEGDDEDEPTIGHFRATAIGMAGFLGGVTFAAECLERVGRDMCVEISTLLPWK